MQSRTQIMSILHSSHRRILLLVEAILLLVAAALFALHYLHLSADFPNYSPWMDWSKYTDEGWYSDAAIRELLRGSWRVPGDFNPAAALPVWPLLELAVFRFTGVSLIAARALAVSVFGLILIAAYILLRRTRSKPLTPYSLAPAIAVLLLATNPFCYAFTRLAILEPMVVLLTLLALIAASAASPASGQGSGWARLRSGGPLIALGILIPLMVLTKTTAAFLLPAVAWMLWASAGYRLRPFLRLGVPAAVLAALLWGGYYGLLVRPHFLVDYRYLFSANAYTGMTRENALPVLRQMLEDGMWMGKLIYPLGILATLIVLAGFRRFRRDPLIPSLLLWAFGYLAFLAYHNNLQPRYYLVVAIPLTLLVPVLIEDLVTGAPAPASPSTLAIASMGRLRAASIGLAGAGLILIAGTDAGQMLHYVRTPQYTFIRAAEQLRRIIVSDRSHSPLVLSISGSDLSLMTGLPSICDDFGSMDLVDRVATYHPGWYVTWNEVDDDKMNALAPFYHLERVAAFPAMDDPERNLLILYRLDRPIPGARPLRHHRTIPPRLLQTTLGQQPSTTQLEH
ncbi:MAG TPA: hypothetical protein VH250_02850 [Granulicella sp.]|nr:hypothetical protein [Granulicella sp.]